MLIFFLAPMRYATIQRFIVSSSLNVGLKRSHREQKAMDRPYYILLADNHAGFRREVRKILEEIPGVKVTGEAGNRRRIVRTVAAITAETGDPGYIPARSPGQGRNPIHQIALP